MVRVLCECGANPNELDRSGMPMLTIPACQNTSYDEQIVKILLKNAAKTSLQAGESGLCVFEYIKENGISASIRKEVEKYHRLEMRGF